MAMRRMREVRAGEVPIDGGTAVQEDPGRPVFRGHGADDWVCVKCATLLASIRSKPSVRSNGYCNKCLHKIREYELHP